MLRDLFSPIVEPSPGGQVVRRCWPWAMVVALMAASLNVILIVTIDNTNIGTGNGLWKAPLVSAWEHGRGVPIDGGGVYYLPTYGMLARLVPEKMLQYGAPSPTVTFRKMAVLNGIFGGIASGLVFLLALRFTGSPWAASIAALAHGSAGFILLDSINSEDIVPAYTFFIAATVCFFEFLHLGRSWLLLASAIFFAFATLLHWTLMVPGLFAFGITVIVLMVRRKSFVWIGVAWLALFLGTIQAALLLVPAHPSFWEVMYPAKAATGWVGFHAEKLLYCAIGIGNYFHGAKNIPDWRVFGERSLLTSIVISWVYFLASLAVCIATLWSRTATVGLKCLAIFALALVIGGEAEDLYSQPQDPQMQIQPMFATIVGVIILMARWFTGAWTTLRRCLVVASAVTLALNGATNIRSMRLESGADSRSLAVLQELDNLFPRENTVIVSQGFDVWVAWQFAVTWQGDYAGLLGRSVHLASAFTGHRGITGHDAALVVEKEIDDAFSSGLHVVAFSLWTEPQPRFVSELTTVASEDQARVFDSLLRNRYPLGRHWQSTLGEFVELLPPGNREAPSK